MIRNVFTWCIIGLVFSCSSDEPDGAGDSYFHALEFPNAVGAIRIISDDETVVIANSSSSTPISLTGLNKKGNIRWSKVVSIEGASDLFIGNVVPANDNNFLVIASGGMYSVIITADYDGNILSASRYVNASEAIAISHCTLTATGSKICSGTYYESGSQAPHGLVFKEDIAGNIIWAKTISLPGESTYIQAILNQSENAICIVSNHTKITILDLDGEVVSSNFLNGLSDYLFEDIETIGDNFYAVYNRYQGQDYVVLKIDKQGNNTKIIKTQNAYTSNPDIYAFGSSLFVSSEIESELKIAELDADLNVINENTFARLNGVQNGLVHGRVSASAETITCLIDPFTEMPPFGANGINVVSVSRKNWKPACKIAEPIHLLTVSNSNRTEEPIELSIGDYAIEKQTAATQQTNQTIEVSVICH